MVKKNESSQTLTISTSINSTTSESGDDSEINKNSNSPNNA